jgi:hypothetical protein
MRALIARLLVVGPLVGLLVGLVVAPVVTTPPALAQGVPQPVPGAVCMPSAQQRMAELRRVREGDERLAPRRAMLICLAEGGGPRRRPLRWT